MILAFSGWYCLWCWAAASTAAVWAQCWHWRQSFASLLVSGCAPLGAGWHFGLPEMWTAWQEEDWVCVQCRRCTRQINISAVWKNGSYLKTLFCHWNVRVFFFWNFVWNKFAKKSVFKNLASQVPWGLRKCFLFGLSLWRCITRLSSVAYFKKVSSSNLILCVQ